MAQFIFQRGLAAEASAQPAQESPVAPDVKCTVMPNKLLVSSLDLCGPLSRVTLAFKLVYVLSIKYFNLNPN